MSRQPSPTYRISRAALGKHLAAIIRLDEQGSFSPDEFRDTMLAIYNLILDPAFEPPEDSHINRTVYDEQRHEIEKSARRSEVAREAARRRKEKKESSVNHTATSPVQGPIYANPEIDDEEIARQVRACVRRQIGPHPHRYKQVEATFHPPSSAWLIK